MLCKRLRHPYYGKVGRITGKVKFGEKLEDAVKRELYEETGLTVKNTKLLSIYRKIRNDDHGNPVQDVMFYIFEVKNPTGTMIKESEFQQNFWVNEKDCKTRDDLYEDFKWGDSKTDKPLTIKESIGIASGY